MSSVYWKVAMMVEVTMGATLAEQMRAAIQVEKANLHRLRIGTGHQSEAFAAVPPVRAEAVIVLVVEL